MKTMKIVALVQATPMAIYRILSLCRRYRVQIESVTVARTEREAVSRLTLIVRGAPATPLIAQLHKLVDVREVALDERAADDATDQSPSRCTQDTSPFPCPFPLHSAQADGAF